MITPARQLMTLMVFLGVVVGLLILRLVPGLLLRLVLAIPRHRLAAIMRWVRARGISVALPRNSAKAPADATIMSSPARAWPSEAGARLVLIAGSGCPGHHRLLDLALHRPDDAAAAKPFWSQRRRSRHRGSAFSCASSPFFLTHFWCSATIDPRRAHLAFPLPFRSAGK